MMWRPQTLTRVQMEERRREGARLLRAGKLTQAQIARQLAVSRASVSVWKAKLAAGGLRALWAHVSAGRPSRLQPEQGQALLTIMKRGARAAGCPTERWTMRRVQAVIEHEFQVTYHPRYVGRLLHHLGWSVQKPEARARERDEGLIRAWLEHDWPRIKKGAAIRRRNRVRG
jgi:putative transposase